MVSTAEYDEEFLRAVQEATALVKAAAGGTVDLKVLARQMFENFSKAMTSGTPQNWLRTVCTGNGMVIDGDASAGHSETVRLVTKELVGSSQSTPQGKQPAVTVSLAPEAGYLSIIDFGSVKATPAEIEAYFSKWGTVKLEVKESWTVSASHGLQSRGRSQKIRRGVLKFEEVGCMPTFGCYSVPCAAPPGKVDIRAKPVSLINAASRSPSPAARKGQSGKPQRKDSSGHVPDCEHKNARRSRSPRRRGRALSRSRSSDSDRPKKGQSNRRQSVPLSASKLKAHHSPRRRSSSKESGQCSSDGRSGSIGRQPRRQSAPPIPGRIFVPSLRDLSIEDHLRFWSKWGPLGAKRHHAL